MKAKKGRERKGLKTFRRFPQSSICADGTPNKQENKKRYLEEEREEDGDVQKKMRRESLNLHEVDMMFFRRRGCMSSSARINEAYSLELPGIGEWPGNSWSSGCPEEGGP